MNEYFTQISALLGISPLIFLLINAILIWSLVWKLLALWKSARKGSVIWFVALAIFNTIGILPILYIFIFSKMKCCQPSKKKGKSKKKK